MYIRIIKRFIDLITSLLGLVLLFPILFLLTVLLFLVNSGSPFFIQKRVGIHGVKFQLYKFRTMNNKLDEVGKLLPDNERLTLTGKFIRSTSLDELPQLLNVLTGKMSLIGPRPLPAKYLPRYNIEQAKRHKLKPGITGWAQVNGRNGISWNERFEYDSYYVENVNFILDLKIFWITIKKVIFREGINSGTNTTMEEFKGSNLT